MNMCLSDLENHQSISYANINGENVISANWESVTIEGCVISDCSISDTSLFSSDTICTSINTCKFSNINFAHSDICSIIAIDTEFKNVDFSTAAMRDCEYKSCVFSNCKFEHIAMTYTKFSDCIFKNIIIEQSSSYLNEFYNCIFENCHFEGNFFYSIFYNCILCDNLFPSKLKAFNALMDNVEPENDDNSEDIISYLEKDFLFLNIEIYRLNMLEISMDTFVLESLFAISQLVKHNIVIRLEQIEFLQKIFEYTCQFYQLPLLTIQQGINIIDKIFEASPSNYISLQKLQQCLNQLKNSMYLEYVKRINNLPKLSSTDYTASQTMIYKITYNEEPTIQLSDIINKILKKLNINDVTAKRIKTEKGSFVEFIELLNAAQPIIQIILSLTTGVLVPIVLEKIKSGSKKQQDNPQTTQNLNAINSNINSPTILYNYNIILSDFDLQTQHVAQIASQVLTESQMSAVNGYLGYSIENIKTIEASNQQNM